MKATKNTMKNGHIFHDHAYTSMIFGGSGSGKNKRIA